MICEVQQNSNSTYRVYDYDRTDKFGNKRPLHIEQAIAVATTKPAENYKRVGNLLAKCKYFTVEELDISDTAEIDVTDQSFQSLIVVDGQGELSNDNYTTKFKKGDSIFIPAQNNIYKIHGKCRVILTHL